MDVIYLYEQALENRLIRAGRRAGNTTRMVDLAVQLLFQGYRVVVEDHHRLGEGTRHIQQMLFRRLAFEHGVKIETRSDAIWRANALVFDPDKNELHIDRPEKIIGE